jgi:dTMP kinase
VGYFAVDGVFPDLTIILDLPPEVAALRAARGRERDRIERRSPAYHALVHEGYRTFAERAAARGERVAFVAARLPIDRVFRAVLGHAEACLGAAELRRA